MTATKITGWDAIELAEQDESVVLHKYADPLNDACDVSINAARAIAHEDPSLIWTEA